MRRRTRPSPHCSRPLKGRRGVRQKPPPGPQLRGVTRPEATLPCRHKIRTPSTRTHWRSQRRWSTSRPPFLPSSLLRHRQTSPQAPPSSSLLLSPRRSRCPQRPQRFQDSRELPPPCRQSPSPPVRRELPPLWRDSPPPASSPLLLPPRRRPSPASRRLPFRSPRFPLRLPRRRRRPPSPIPPSRLRLRRPRTLLPRSRPRAHLHLERALHPCPRLRRQRPQRPRRLRRPTRRRRRQALPLPQLRPRIKLHSRVNRPASRPTLQPPPRLQHPPRLCRRPRIWRLRHSRLRPTMCRRLKRATTPDGRATRGEQPSSPHPSRRPSICSRLSSREPRRRSRTCHRCRTPQRFLRHRSPRRRCA